MGKTPAILLPYLVLIIQGGTVSFCGIMSVTMRNHGGEHAWDITAADAQQAAYVSWLHQSVRHNNDLFSGLMLPRFSMG
jgi:hypothetical protein